MFEIIKGGGNYFFIKQNNNRIELNDSDCIWLILMLSAKLYEWSKGCRIIIDDN